MTQPAGVQAPPQRAGNYARHHRPARSDCHSGCQAPQMLCWYLPDMAHPIQPAMICRPEGVHALLKGRQLRRHHHAASCDCH